MGQRAMVGGVKARLTLFQFQMIAAQLLALNAADRAVGYPLFGPAIIDHMDREAAARLGEHADFLDALASGPKPDLMKAVSRQICPANSHGVSQEAHGASRAAA